MTGTVTAPGVLSAAWVIAGAAASGVVFVKDVVAQPATSRVPARTTLGTRKCLFAMVIVFSFEGESDALR
ncbi:hypothetical protein D3C86_1863530 [compost metagenome]